MITMLYETIKELCPSWEITNLQDFGLEAADNVADFFNNGGLEFYTDGLNHSKGLYSALQYAAVIGDKVEIGAWVWQDGEDFDEDATFEIYEEIDFSRKEREMIVNKIREIYDTPRH